MECHVTLTTSKSKFLWGNPPWLNEKKKKKKRKKKKKKKEKKRKEKTKKRPKDLKKIRWGVNSLSGLGIGKGAEISQKVVFSPGQMDHEKPEGHQRPAITPHDTNMMQEQEKV